MMGKCDGKKCGGVKIAWILVIIGALNWGLVGIGGFASGNWDLVEAIFGKVAWLRDVIYILVGLSGLMLLVGCKCKSCKGGSCAGGSCDAGGMEQQAEHHDAGDNQHQE